MKKGLIIIIFMLFSGYVFSQNIQTDTTISLNSLIQDTLIGGCMNVSNITSNNGAYGYFSNSNQAFPFRSGIVLSTGHIISTEGPDDTVGSSDFLFSSIDIDLQQMIMIDDTIEVNESTVVEFDFIPESSEVSFNYIFASEEFPDFVNSYYNDVFGFFISGPGINGPYSNNAENIALLPNGNPVTIDNVYNSSTWYIGPVGLYRWTGGDAYNHAIQFNGATTVLTATAVVQPFHTYHIKLAIGDVGDGRYDSGIFLEVGSFTSGIANVINNSGFTELNCYDTLVNVTAEGGVEYIWSNSVNIPENVLTAPGTYVVTVNPLSSCSTTASITITENFVAPNVSITNNTGTYLLDCNVRNINLTATGATSYIWDNNINSATNIVSSPGTYNVTGYLSSNPRSECVSSASITLYQDIIPPGINIVNNSGTNTLDCNINSLDLTAVGAGTFRWSSGNNEANITVSTTGTYTVTITGQNGCTNSSSITIIEDRVSETDIINRTGTATLTCDITTIDLAATGGISFLWNNGVNSSNNAITQPGNYSVTTTGSNGCTSSKSINIYRNISVPQVNIVSNSGEYELNCRTNPIYLIASGGRSYVWNNGIRDASSIITDAGLYTVTVTGYNGCTGMGIINISEDYTIPQISINKDDGTTELSCHKQSLDFTASGGVLYSWSGGKYPESPTNTFFNPGTYVVTVYGRNGCSNSSNIIITQIDDLVVDVSFTDILCHGGKSVVKVEAVQGTPPFSGIGEFCDILPGIHNFVVRDANNCHVNNIIVIEEPDNIKIDLVIEKSVSCYGFSDAMVVANVSGGNGDYVFKWNDSGETDNNIINDLSAGVWKVEVTDKNDCYTNAKFVVTQPDPLEIEKTIIKHVTCNGGSDGEVFLHLKGGIFPYSYTLYNEHELLDRPKNKELKSGNYLIDIKDKNGCKLSSYAIVEEPEKLEVNYSLNNPSCVGYNDGSIEFNVFGGTEPYFYRFNNKEYNSSIIGKLRKGVYGLEIIDDNSCKIILENLKLTDAHERCIKIPDAFTPNGDGINDNWIIEGIEKFPEAIIQVFNRWGQIVYEGNIYDDPWNGKYKNSFVPTGTYVYAIKLFNESSPETGTVSVIY